MSLIEGIGDEVIEFFIGLLIVIIGTIAWWSTRITDRPAIRTVLVFERRAQNRQSPIHNRQSTSATTEETESRNYVREMPAVTEENKPPGASTSESENVEGASSDATTAGEEDERTEIIQNMDSNCVVRRRRIDFFNQREVPTNGSNTPDGSVESVESVCSNNSTVETNTDTENDTYHVEPTQTDDTNSVPQTDIPKSEVNDITIKLKYINDDLKLVNGKLQEPLGDFRRRHFELELSSNKLVKLIFNGQVLQRDDITLQGCGLFDNCVVHCLVHQKRPNPLEQSVPGSSVGPDGRALESNRRVGTNREIGREWDLGNLFFAIVSFILGAAWYFRYEYAQLYTVTATIALVGLTGIFTVLLVGMYFPDPEPVQQQRS